MDIAPKTENKRCFCALCTNTFIMSDDNLIRRRNLHDLCRMMEDSRSPPMEPTKKEQLLKLLEGELKKRDMVSLCNGCNLMVGAFIREQQEADGFEHSIKPNLT